MTDHSRSARDVTDGLNPDELRLLCAEHNDTLVTLLARVSERSYRRGVQQGVTFAETRPRELREDLAAWRYQHSADDAPWADGARIELSAERLLTENRALELLGFRVPAADSIMPDLRHDPTYVPRR